MAIWEELLQQARTLKDQVLPADAQPGHVKTSTHNPLVEKIISLIENHAADQEKHAGSFPAGAKGDMLWHNGTNFITLPAGELGQILEMQTVDDDIIPQWITKNLGNDFQLFYDDGGHCYLKNETATGIAILKIVCKNVWLYDQSTHLKRYITYDGSREFVLTLYSAYGISRTAFTEGIEGNVPLIGVEIPNADYYMLITRAPAISGAAGQLAELALLYSSIAGGWIPLSADEHRVNIDLTNVISSGRFLVTSDDFIKFNAIPGIPDGARDGIIVVKNTNATDSISVSFGQTFNTALYSVDAGKTAMYMYARLTGSKYTVFELVKGNGEITINDVLGLQEELAGKIPATEKAAVNGVATLGTDGLLLASQRPPGSADENVKVGASGTSDYLNEAYFSQHETNHIRPKITQGKMWQGGVDDVPVEVDPPSGGGASKYIDLVAGTDFNTTAASASTITMLTNQTNNIFPGMAIRFTLSGVLYYAVCTAITANLLTIAGAPLTTTPGALTTIGYSNLPNSTASEVISISGAFADALSTTLIQNDLLLKGGLFWKKSKAFCVQMSIICTDLDTGTVTTEAQLNTKINGNNLLNSNLIVDSILQNSVVNINTLNYEINYNESIEIELAALAAGTPNYDALNLTVYLTFVFP